MITTKEIKQITTSWAQSLPYKVRIHLYGSYWKGNKYPPSDIDIAFEFFDDQLLDDPLLLWFDNHEKWQKYLSEKFGMNVDLQLCDKNSNISKYLIEASLLLYDASETEDKSKNIGSN